MTDDLVQRLRRTYRKEFPVTGSMIADNSNRLRPFPILAAEVPFNPDGHEAANRIEQLEREKAVVSDLWEQQKEIALDYLTDCNKAADRIEAQATECEILRQPTQSDAAEKDDTWIDEFISVYVAPKDVTHVADFLRSKYQPTQSDDEAYELGKRDGYESAVQDIDMLTGGDGEYRYSTIGGERHCPDPDSMKARIAERFTTQSDALPAVGTKGEYLRQKCTVTAHVEGWLEVVFSADRTLCVIRPSRFAALQEQANG